MCVNLLVSVLESCIARLQTAYDDSQSSHCMFRKETVFFSLFHVQSMHQTVLSQTKACEQWNFVPSKKNTTSQVLLIQRHLKGSYSFYFQQLEIKGSCIPVVGHFLSSFWLVLGIGLTGELSKNFVWLDFWARRLHRSTQNWLLESSRTEYSNSRRGFHRSRRARGLD